MDFEAARRTMVDTQIRPNDVTEPDIVGAFLNVPREAFVPASKRSIAYSEFEIRTGEGRALWTPRDTAKLIKTLDPDPDDACLVIGAGAGYEAAILAHLAETVIALEDSEERVSRLGQRLADLGLDRAVAVEGKLTEGLPGEGPFDAIMICGMVEQVPEALTDQLAEGGRLAAVVEIDEALGRGRVYTRSGDVTGYRETFDARPPKFEAFDKPDIFEF
ncbi:MAG: protein-L-isoaspartate O-methyltransferase [Alphaproteobacteria bacterium]|jgi:protein-L-isoaspartate(D-aspartate) O-methyltransferase|nr:protein-L-isoaspartate O-methyltransferase [Alphaproteobacteria bacterium]